MTSTSSMFCFCAQSRRVARHLTRLYQQALAGAGLNPAQFEILSHLTSPHQLSQSGLATLLSTDQTTLSRNLKLLLKQQLIQSAPSSKDARRSIYTLTPTGRQTYATALPLWQAIHTQVEAALGSTAIPTRQALDRLAALSL